MREELIARLKNLSEVGFGYDLTKEDKRALIDAAEALARPESAQVRVKPEAVEALASYQQADEDGIMVLVSRQAIEECLPVLHAALEPDTVTGWRDISTAPKDGTRVMLSYDGSVTAGRYWDAFNDGTAEWFDDSDDVLCGYLEPSHWMPLPPAPEKEG